MTLRPLIVSALFCAVLASASPAKAEPKFLGLEWWPSHWEQTTFKPYLDQPVYPQNSQWEDKTWQPADWNAQRKGGAAELIQGFYTTGIFKRQYTDDNVPVLEVGPRFYDLSGYDKRRVLRILDEEYKITSGHENGMFTLADGRTGKPIGLYTAYGLQLQ
ncbi:MAG: hypothetical protein JWO78_1086 [Micavibrio sp.]|nr:hypothetical protein [Micavibrio sp.]